MENFVYVIIAVAYGVYYIVRAANKNKTAPKRPPVQARPPAAQQQPRTLAQQQAQRRDAESAQRERDQQRNRESQSSPRSTTTASPSRGKSVFDILREELEGQRNQSAPPRPEPMERDPFLEREEEEIHPALKARREAQRLREEKRAAERAHFSEERLVEEFKRTHSQGKQVSHHTHDYFEPKKDALKGKMQIERAKAHPMNKLLKGRKNIRNAIILKEILDRKF